ncbi:MAG: terminase large subunit [Proteobacteria bacterium]|nr:terminase large subunit [Pseudomonadota bacterium]
MERPVNYYVSAAIQYAEQVLSGEIIACKWTKAACRRQLDDLKFSGADKDYPYEFDIDEAEYVCKFIELLPHVKGKWVGEKIKLEPWQMFIITTVFGWYSKQDNSRRFRTVYIEVPRKNAKSTLTSGVSLYMLTGDNEPGAEIYSAATTRDQARIVFETARLMAKSDAGFRKRFGVAVLEHSIYETINSGKYIPLSAEGSTLDGLNIHFASIDELHAHKTRAVFDVLETATGSREQPLIWGITTAGFDRSGICYEQRNYVASLLNATLLKNGGLGYKVKGQVAEDNTYFGIIYTIDDEDDWTKPECWVKANPNYGISVSEVDIEKLARKAQKVSSAKNNFLTKRLNVWVNASEAWMDMVKWESCANPDIKLSDFAGEKCWIGMDLAEKKDFAALVLAFWREGKLHVFPRLYLNDDRIESGGNDQYEGWRESGHIIGNEGDITDFDQIKDDLIAYSKQFDLQEVPFDPAFSPYFATKLVNDHSIPMVEMRQTSLTFTAAIIELENLVLEKTLVFDGNPVLTWMMSNAVISTSKFSNLKSISKERDTNKIDGVIALLLALARAMTSEREEKPGIMIL